MRDTEEEYEFYKNLTQDHQAPLAYTHFSLEGSGVIFGSIVYSAKTQSSVGQHELPSGPTFVPKTHPSIEHANDLLPPYLRFVCGVVDSPMLNSMYLEKSYKRPKLLKQSRSS